MIRRYIVAEDGREIPIIVDENCSSTDFFISQKWLDQMSKQIDGSTLEINNIEVPK